MLKNKFVGVASVSVLCIFAISSIFYTFNTSFDISKVFFCLLKFIFKKRSFKLQSGSLYL
jgi:hypothetical protein